MGLSHLQLVEVLVVMQLSARAASLKRRAEQETVAVLPCFSVYFFLAKTAGGERRCVTRVCCRGVLRLNYTGLCSP